MIYTLILKSHSDAPDIEREVEAESFDEALDFFSKWLAPYGWDRKIIADNIVSEDKFTK